MEAAIDKCTDYKQFDDNWELILHITDTYAATNPKMCLKQIMKKLYHQNPNVCLRAITLLDSCMKNVGDSFVSEVSSKTFSTAFKSKYPKLDERPRIKLLELTKKWSEEYQSKAQFNLLSTLFSWVMREYPLDAHLLGKSNITNSSAEKRATVRGLQAKEEEDLAKAIAMSLNETKLAKSSAGGSIATENIYGDLGRAAGLLASSQLASKGPTKSGDLGQVRALFDFEAAEDNELTFKAEEIIILLDDSDPNWWRGQNHRGEGLFPAQFVTKDVNAVIPAQKSNELTPAAADKAVEEASSTEPLMIDPELLATCLQMLSDADSTGEMRPDPPELAMFEAKARAMEPLIDRELQEADTRINEVTELNKKLVDALQLYHDLMSRAPAQPAYSSMYQTMGQKMVPSYIPPPTVNTYQIAAPVGNFPATGQTAPFNYQASPQQHQQQQQQQQQLPGQFVPSSFPVQPRPPMMTYQQVPQGYSTQVPYFPPGQMPTNYPTEVTNYPGRQSPYPGPMIPTYGGEAQQPQYYVLGQQQMNPRNPEYSTDST